MTDHEGSIIELKSTQWFDWQWKRLAYAQASYWPILKFQDNTEYTKIGFGLYWQRQKKSN